MGLSLFDIDSKNMISLISNYAAASMAVRDEKLTKSIVTDWTKILEEKYGSNAIQLYEPYMVMGKVFTKLGITHLGTFFNHLTSWHEGE